MKKIFRLVLNICLSISTASAAFAAHEKAVNQQTLSENNYDPEVQKEKDSMHRNKLLGVSGFTLTALAALGVFYYYNHHSIPNDYSDEYDKNFSVDEHITKNIRSHNGFYVDKRLLESLCVIKQGDFGEFKKLKTTDKGLMLFTKENALKFINTLNKVSENNSIYYIWGSEPLANNKKIKKYKQNNLEYPVWIAEESDAEESDAEESDAALFVNISFGSH